MASARPLPEGTVTFLFTDIEGSTKLWERHPEAMRVALARHDALLRHAIAADGGHVFKSMGGQFCAAFATAPEAVSGALAAQRALHAETWGEVSPLRVRMVLHTGALEYREGDYFGPPLSRLSRLLDAGHGGQILLSRAASDLVRSALPEAASLRDLGTHRLKDLQQPEPLFQLVHPDLPGEFPPLRSMEAFAHNLPIELSRFIGREQAMAEVKRLHASTRLLTLTGSGGCGKTRLALKVAVDLLEEYGDGVWLVELAPLADPVLLPQTVAAALGVREESGRPLTATLRDYLRPKQALLVLDNCEHLLSACAELAEALLRVCPQLRILASSREALGIGGEQTYRVPSLSFPDGRHLPPMERLHEFEAVQLFADRARSSEATFAVTEGNAPAVAQICHRLDGIPLALELAAAWAHTLTPTQLLERLTQRFDLLVGHRRDVPPRHQSLRAAIEWSYQLLSPELRQFFARLSVFRGGWTLEAAEAVAGAGERSEWPGPGRALSALQQLQERSLVVAEEAGEAMRYRLLETLREFAAEQVEPGECRELTRRHATFFLALVERADAASEDEDGPARLREVAQEYDNLRAALDGCFPSDPGGDAAPMTEDVELGLALGAALGSFWIVRGYFTEGRRYLRALLARSEALESRARARAYIIAGRLAQLQDGSDAAACQLLDAGLAMARALEDRSLVASTLLFYGDQARAHLTAEQCQARCEEALAIYRELGDRRGAAVALITLGLVCGAEHGRRARAFYEEGVAALRELGPSRSLAWACLHLSNTHYYMGAYGPASAVGGECLSLFEQFAEPVGIAACHNLRGKIALAQGDLPNARRHFERLRDLSLDLGSPPSVAEARVHLGDVDLAAGDVEGAAALYRQALAAAREVNARDQVAASLAGLGRAALRRGDAQQAASHFVECLSMDHDWHHPQSAVPCLEGVACALTLAAGPVLDPAMSATAVPPPELLRAARLFGAAEALRDRIGVQLPPQEQSEHDGWIAPLRACLGNADLAAAWDAGRILSWEEAVTCALGYSWSLEAFARLAAPEDPERAARLWEAAEALRETRGLPLPPNELEEYDRYRSAARNLLDEEPFAIAWAEGRAMSPEQAVASALEDSDEAEPHRRALESPSRDVPADAAAARLPRPLTPFFGREAEISQVRARLEAPGARLVTLTGLGGTGKTRLALEVARLSQENGAEWHGVGIISLTDITDPRLIGQTIREALNLPAAGAADPLEQIALHLGDQPFLLVLDNFEPLLPKGAATVRELLERTSRLVCLVTSRRPLGLPAEAEFPVAPLPTPTASTPPERLPEFASVRLFVDRAQAARPEFQITPTNAAVVTQLCQALEGIPLALELAAARAPVLTPVQMLQHLSDRFGFLEGRPRDVAERHRTLRAALEWSYQALPERQQRLLARLSVFRGGWALEAVHGVCGEGLQAFGPGTRGAGAGIQAEPVPRPERPNAQDHRQTAPAVPPERLILDDLTDLQRASLVLAEEVGEAMRFRTLETVREYAAERLAERGETEAIQTRHRDWCLQVAERAVLDFDGPAFVPCLERLEAERDNLREALAWSLRHDEDGADAGLRLAGALGRFWEVRGYLSEGRACLEEALQRERSAGRTQGRARALLWAGVLAHNQGDHGSAMAHYQESLAISRELTDQEGVASVLDRLGNLTQEQGESAEARRFHEESLAIRQKLGDSRGIALSLNVGNAARDYAAAKQSYEECLTIFRDLGDRHGMCASRHFLGVVAEHEGDMALARSIYEECLPVWRELRFPVQVAWTLNGIGYVSSRLGDFPTARSRLAESLAMFREMEYTAGLVLSVERLGGLAAARGQGQRAVRLLAAGERQRAATGTRASLAAHQDFERDVAGVRAALEVAAFESAWADGQAMTLQQAVEYALREDEEPEASVDQGAAGDRTPLLATKLAPPALSPGLLPRPRLTARLDLPPSAGTPIALLALLDASAGSGKSSVVNQWSQEQREGSVAWLSLDREDNDPARFLLYLCAAMESVAPAAAAPVRALLQAAQQTSLEAALTLLLNGIAELEQPVALVLDDYHEIEAAPVRELVGFLVERLPPTLFLILTTRSDPPLPLARLRLQGRLIEIHDDELRFTDEEAGQFLKERMGLTLPPEVVQRLAERTEGWIAGLQMAALSLQSEADAGRFMDAFTGTDRYLVDYFFEEVLRRLPPEVQRFLGRTAFLKRLCAPLCEAVTGIPDGRAMLERLEAAHLFLIPMDRARQWYRYHPLFADVLQARLLPEQEEPLAVLQERAAAWYEAEGMVGEAIEHALAGGQFERAARLVKQHGAAEPAIARLEALLETWEKQGREAPTRERVPGPRSGWTLGARVLLAKLHWQVGRREQAIAVLQPALALAEREEHTRVFVEAGPALIPALRQAAVQGIAPETVGKLLTKLGAGGAQPAGARPGAASAGPSPDLVEPLSERELEVLRLVAAGLRNAEIAAQLFLAVGTVERHIHNLYGKLGANSRTSALSRARALGLL